MQIHFYLPQYSIKLFSIFGSCKVLADSFDHFKKAKDLPVLYIKWKGIHLDPCNFVARVKHGFSEVWQEISFQHILNAIMFNLSQIKEKIHITTNMNIHCQIHMEFIVPQFFILYTIVTIWFLSLKNKPRKS